MAILGPSHTEIIGGEPAHGMFCITPSQAASGADGNEILGGYKSIVAAMPACRLTDQGTCGGHSIRPS